MKDQDIAHVLLEEARITGRRKQAESLVRRSENASDDIPKRALMVVSQGWGDTSPLRETPAYVKAEEWASQLRTGALVLEGAVGCGKTVAAAHYAYRRSSDWCYAPKLGMISIAESSAVVSKLVRARSLVLDDLGSQGSTKPFAIERIVSILHARHERMVPTVITTNLDRAKIAQVYDGVSNPDESRLIDRLQDGGEWFRVPSHKGGSLRGRFEVGTTVAARAKRFLSALDDFEAVIRGHEALSQRSVRYVQGVLKLEDSQLQTLAAKSSEDRARVQDMILSVSESSRFAPEDECES